MFSIKSFLFQTLIAVFIAFTFSACFQLREEIYLNKDGSGTYKMLFDLSQNKAILDAFKAMDSTGGQNNTFTASDSSMSKMASELNGLEGVSNAKSINEADNYIAGFQFDFKDVKALNAALGQFGQSSMFEEPNYYKFSKKNFSRNNSFYLKKLTDEMTKNNDGGEEAEQLKMFLSSATYSFAIYTDKKIKSCSNKKFEQKAKEVRITLPLMEAAEGTADFQNKIGF